MHYGSALVYSLSVKTRYPPSWQSFLFLYVNAWRREGAISPIKQTAFRKSRLERLLTGTLADLLFILLKDFCCDLLKSPDTCGSHAGIYSLTVSCLLLTLKGRKAKNF